MIFIVGTTLALALSFPAWASDSPDPVFIPGAINPNVIQENIQRAAWVKVGQNENHATYADPATILRESNKVKVWRLLDFKTHQAISDDRLSSDLFLSMVEQTEYDCEEKQSRTLYISLHSGNMGKGRLVDANEIDTDTLIRPPFQPEATLSEADWEFACGKPPTTPPALTEGAKGGAEWVEVGKNENHNIYADRATLRRAGNRVRMWILSDYKIAKMVDRKPYMSIKGQEEYDCEEAQSRQLYASWYSENMGLGKVVSMYVVPRPWAPIAPGSLDEDLWKIACGKQ